jgi:putative endonuclease
MISNGVKTEKQQLGAWGESLVARHYVSSGYELVARNFRCSFGELDLICVKADILYCLEVKTRRSLIFGHPEESINPQKQARLMRLAAAFLDASDRTYIGVRIQICAVTVYRAKVMLKIYTI